MEHVKTDFLIAENVRNKKSGKLFTDMLREAFGEPDGTVVIGHHLTFDGIYTEPNEIPSADCLIFCHSMMQAIFGPQYQEVITQLALTPADKRDARLAEFYYNRPAWRENFAG